MSVKDKNPEIYVRGYSRKVQKQELKDMFKKFGKIRSIQFKGPYSFIVSHTYQQYEDYYDAEQAVDKMHDMRVDGLRLTVEPAGKKRRPRKYARSRSISSKKHRRSSSSLSESSEGSRRSSSSSSESSESKKEIKIKEEGQEQEKVKVRLESCEGRDKPMKDI